jgi:hypothetical protein
MDRGTSLSILFPLFAWVPRLLHVFIFRNDTIMVNIPKGTVLLDHGLIFVNCFAICERELPIRVRICL